MAHKVYWTIMIAVKSGALPEPFRKEDSLAALPAASCKVLKGHHCATVLPCNRVRRWVFLLSFFAKPVEARPKQIDYKWPIIRKSAEKGPLPLSRRWR
jgi:hypothetical protein